MKPRFIGTQYEKLSITISTIVAQDGLDTSPKLDARSVSSVRKLWKLTDRKTVDIKGFQSYRAMSHDITTHHITNEQLIGTPKATFSPTSKVIPRQTWENAHLPLP